MSDEFDTRSPSEIMKMLERLDKRSLEQTYMIAGQSELIRANTETLNKLSMEQVEYMSCIADNTKKMADALSSQADSVSEVTSENKELVKIISGKHQVPLSIFLTVLFIISLMFGIIMIYFTHVNLTVETSKVQITPKQDTPINPNPQPAH